MIEGWNVDKSRAAWWTIGAALGVTALYIVYSFIGTFVFGIFIYYSTRPVYDRLKRRIGPPSLAAAIALFALALPALLLMTYTGAIAIQELRKFAGRTNIQELPEPIQPYADVSNIVQSPGTLLSGGIDTKLAQDVFGSTLGYIGFVGTAVLHLFVMIAIAFYLLRDDHKLSRWFRRTFSDSEGVLDSYVTRVDTDFNSIFFGNILNALLTGTIGAISYNVLDYVAPAGLSIPYPTLLGLLTGVASLIPVVGMKLVYFPVSAYVGAETLLLRDPTVIWFPVVFFLVSLVIVDTIPDLVLRPYVSGRNLHVGMVMLAYIFGPLLFGWYGIFLGPMILVLVVHFGEIVLPELLAGRPIKPWAVDPTYLNEGHGTARQPRDRGDVPETGSEPVDADEAGSDAANESGQGGTDSASKGEDADGSEPVGTPSPGEDQK
ncbi:AI-2E family transporter [Halomicrococcus sp. SG-WS-1]|uniref:AI-2E family transporter n=1 Tax=Halomicrococcus sp. SG-WS-1 TaxID=3439057 RepID=UPI003F796FA5